MPFYVIYYHVIWGTKFRRPSITPPIETAIFEAIHEKSRFLNCPIHALNATIDHVHVAVTIPPHVLLYDWVGQVKGWSSHYVNQEFPNLEERFQWQAGYGALTFGKKALPLVQAYIEKQKEHHANNDLMDYLEYYEE